MVGASILADRALVRIVGGAWRGRRLVAPAGRETRPTAERLRQALFDVLMHAPWGGRAMLDGAHVLDLFAGTGALGLEALSRGAGSAEFIENDPAALTALRANIAACGAGARARVIAGDATRMRPGAAACIVFLDPPYEGGMIGSACVALRRSGRLTATTLLVAEAGRDEEVATADLLDDRRHGAGRTLIWHAGAEARS